MLCECCGAFDGETNAEWVKRTHHSWKPLQETHEVIKTIWGDLCQFCAIPEREYWSWTGDPKTARCGRCSRVYAKSHFRKGMRFVQFLWCHECRKAHREEYRTLLVIHYQKLHPEKQQQWIKDHPEKVREYHKTWHKKHPDYWHKAHLRRKKKKLK